MNAPGVHGGSGKDKSQILPEVTRVRVATPGCDTIRSDSGRNGLVPVGAGSRALGHHQFRIALPFGTPKTFVHAGLGFARSDLRQAFMDSQQDLPWPQHPPRVRSA